ncbi:hypothetical protein WJX81_007211 [Elliptochloris bilobata]|uniref:TCTP domain-containing protein n=1 Tax=Elliptochloris bilobata TaxID=381761 RepID=A0AAW1QVF3_9CHLO
MIIYKDKLSGDEMFADSYPMREVEDGFFYEVDGSWQTVGEVHVDTGANASAEEAEETVDDTARKVVDIIESFRLVEQPSYDKKAFMAYIKPWLKRVIEKLPEAEQEEFKAKSQSAMKFLLGKIKELQFFLGESMDPESTMAYAYYKDGGSSPTFLFCKYALDGVKM